MVSAMRSALLQFYDVYARDLPWRRTRDPYAIWVSEIMLQQTRVDTVLRYYDRFLERFPSLQALAVAEQDEVLAAWSGLGYYRRARMLHAGVREVLAHYGGEVPRDAEARRKLPGIGRYTAGAIGSIAFDQQEPLVDGNVARVLCRVLGIDTPVGRADTDARLWQHAEALCQGPRPGALNQALMELGATLCTKATPACERCPLHAMCVARAEQRQGELPVVRAKRPPRVVSLLMLALLDTPGDAMWLVRGEGELFGGLWNFPMREGKGLKAARALLAELAPGVQLEGKASAHFEHVLTHRHFHVALYVARPPAGVEVPQLPTQRWVSRAQLSSLGVSSLTLKGVTHAFATAVVRSSRPNKTDRTSL